MTTAAPNSVTFPYGVDRVVDGEAYYEVLANLHQQLRPRTYMEIGVREGASMRRALPTTRCIGIDPLLRCDSSIHPNATLVEETSDYFFRNHKPSEFIGKNDLDMVFIDGMHLFEYVLRDFLNAEKYCSRDSMIILHDCVPINAETQYRERCTSVWSGDVWKVIPALRKYRPDLKISISGVAPTGLAAITNLNPHDTILREKMAEIVQEFLPLGYEDYLKSAFTDLVDFSELKLGVIASTTRSLYHKFEASKVIESKSKVVPGPSAKPLDCPSAPCNTPAATLDSSKFAINPVPLLPAQRNKAPRMLGVLLCYNDADILPDAIESLLENNHDLIVWDHGSTDGTSSVLDKYSNSIMERTFLPREFDFYTLYPTVSRHIIENYQDKYDWVSWPDQDEILEGPDRTMSYPEHVQRVLDEGFTHVRFDNYNYWFTDKDDANEKSPAKRIRHYCLFEKCSPRIRAWKADKTNERLFNHNPIDGDQYPTRFKLRHYPARDYEKAMRRVLLDRADIQREGMNFHYNRIAQKLEHIVIDSNSLHIDNGVNELHDKVTYDWSYLYLEKGI